MKKLTLLFLCSFITLNFAAQINIPAGTVSGTWAKTNSPYRILGDINVPLGQTLTIQSGVVVEFQGHYMLSIKGNVRAMGAPGDTILFTVNDTLGFHNIESGTGGWNGIKINYNINETQSGDSTVFQFCKFEFGKSIDTGVETGGGAILIKNFSKILIQDCVFRMNNSLNKGGALYIFCNTYAISPDINHCAFINNKAAFGGALCLELLTSMPIIRNCLFLRNQSSQWGGAILSQAGKGLILNNIFNNNVSDYHGGALYFESSQDIITGNLIINNYAKEAGGGIKMNYSGTRFYNNNVCNNHANFAGGGIEFWGLCNADFYNNIIWGNTILDVIKSPNQVRTSTVTSTPNFYNCIIQNGISGIENYQGKSMNIIESDPEFINPSDNTGIDDDGLEGNWTLSAISPAINQGMNSVLDIYGNETDLWGNSRISHGIIDIGAFESRIDSINTAGTIMASTKWIADTVRVTGDIIVIDSAILDIAPGTCVEFQGNYKIQVFGVLTAKGSNDFPIVFTISDTTGFSDLTSDAGCWKGIIFDNSEWGANGAMKDNDSSIISYCIIQYSKQNTSEIQVPSGGAIKIRYYSNIEISNCTIQKNIAISGGGIGIDLFSHPLISGNLIYKNIASKAGGGINIMSDSKPLLINNFILNNAVILSDIYAWSGGGGINAESSSPAILNNVICNNFANYGGAIFLNDSKPLFSGNTICNNLSSIMGPLYFWNSKPDIFNTVIWGNKTQSNDRAEEQIWSGNSLNFFYNNIQGGQDKMYFSHEGLYEGNIDRDPDFTNPTSGPGTKYDALQSDWSISDLSPNINKGLPDIGQFMIPTKDIAGNKRVRHEIIDIGAYENQGDPFHIIRQPFSQMICLGERVEFNVSVSGSASFQWLKNNDTIPGAVTSTLVLNSVERNDKADYIAIIANGYGTILSSSAKLDVISPPEILFQTESHWVSEDAVVRLEVHARGTEPLNFKWLKNGAVIDGANIPELRINSMSFGDEGNYICQVSNMCNIIQSTPITLFVAPQICMVTVDLETGKNLVIWEKNGIAPVTEYNIYRESTVAGQYDRIGNLPHDALSVFVDTIAEPAKKAWIYKITATDVAGTESDIDLCKPHKTIHLITSTNLTTGDVQLSWDPYYGFEYGTYFIYRSQTSSNFLPIYEMSSSTAAYTEANPENVLYYYRVAVERPADCSPVGSGKKADSGPYSHSMSNIEDNRFQTGINNPVFDDVLTIYPNPFIDKAILKFQNPENNIFRLQVIDPTGKVLRYIDDISGSEYILERDNLEKGYYIIELIGDMIYRGRIIAE